jgi:predicted transcriptional regulator
MGKVKVKIRAPFGEIIVEGENPQEILDMLEGFPEDFIEKTSDIVSVRLAPTAAVQLKGVIEFTTEGPVIMTREKLTHYEAIGLVLFASEEKKSTAAHITKLLESSGIKSMVPARLNEMTKKGRVFKPDPNKPEFKLTVQGERWVEEEVLARLRGKMS